MKIFRIVLYLAVIILAGIILFHNSTPILRMFLYFVLGVSIGFDLSNLFVKRIHK